MHRVVKKGTSNVKAYYITPLNYRLTGHPENFKIKLYYFQERLSLRYNIILKLLSLFHICKNNISSLIFLIYVSSETTNFQKDLSFKDHS